MLQQSHVFARHFDLLDKLFQPWTGVPDVCMEALDFLDRFSELYA